MEEEYITLCRTALFKKVFGERKKSMSRINKLAKSPDLDDPGFIFYSLEVATRAEKPTAAAPFSLRASQR